MQAPASQPQLGRPVGTQNQNVQAFGNGAAIATNRIHR
jgi:hypothetical protein